MGYYQPDSKITKFINTMQRRFNISIRYLQEYCPLGTAGGIYHFRDQLLRGDPDALFVLNADVCSDFRLQEMLDFHKGVGSGDHFTMMVTEATRQQSLNYGSVVADKQTHEVLHYVEKPETFISTAINCGVYLLTPSIFESLRCIFNKLHSKTRIDDRRFDENAQQRESIMFERDVFPSLAGSGKLFVYSTNRFWSQIKSAGATIYANRHVLALYRNFYPDRLTGNKPPSSDSSGVGGPKIIGDVYIHDSAQIHPSAKLGPNVSIGAHATVGAGVRIREAIILDNVSIAEHSIVLYSIIDREASIGAWSRIEGTPQDPNPNKPFAKLDIPDVFADDGRLNPAVTVIGAGVSIPSEIVVLNSIVLPNKELNKSEKNRIIL